MVWRDILQMVAAAPGSPASLTAAATRLGLADPGSPHGCLRLMFFHVSTFRRPSGAIGKFRPDVNDAVATVRCVGCFEQYPGAVGDVINHETTDWFPICPAHSARLRSWGPLGKQATETRVDGGQGDDDRISPVTPLGFQRSVNGYARERPERRVKWV